MRTWTVDYINLNNNVSINISEDCDNLIQVDREITVPPLQDYISDWPENQLVMVTETA